MILNDIHVITIIDTELNDTFNYMFKVPYKIYYCIKNNSNNPYPGYILYFNNENYLFFSNDRYKKLMREWVNNYFINPIYLLKEEYLYERFL